MNIPLLGRWQRSTLRPVRHLPGAPEGVSRFPGAGGSPVSDEGEPDPADPQGWAMMAPEQVDGVLMPPPAKPGDIVVVHVPDIGRWRVKQILQDSKGRFYYRVTRNEGKEATTIDAAGVEILVRSV